jgi:predicted transposase
MLRLLAHLLIEQQSFFPLLIPHFPTSFVTPSDQDPFLPEHDVRLTLRTSPSQHAALSRTAVAFADACRDAMLVGIENDSTSNAVIHRHCYYDVRHEYGLSANLTIRAIARAARHLKAYSLLKENPACGSGTSSQIATRRKNAVSIAKQYAQQIEYDARVFSLCTTEWTASVSTVDGRISDIPTLLPSEKKIDLKANAIRRVCLQQRSKTFDALISLT